jgi:hypothetical protein
VSLPAKYHDLILGDLEPGIAYRRSVEALAEDGLTADYALTETIVYATEVRYALDVIRKGPPERLWNFGDLDGKSTDRLWAVLDRVEGLRLAFAGSGPYPITALLAAQRYPQARITCIDNNIVGHLLGQAVVERMGLPIDCTFAEAIDVDYAPFNAVVIAAMVSGKTELVQRALDTSEALVVVRGETGVRHDRLVEITAQFRDDGSVRS